MSQSGQQHPKADVGGQRADPKKSDEAKESKSPSVRETVDAGKKPGATSDAKK
jgi:hypothetical protein